MSVVKINAISVPPQAGRELERRFAERAHTVEGSPGFLGFQLLRPTQGEDRYFVVTEWADEDSFAAWRDGDARSAHAGQHGQPVSTGASLLEFEVVLEVRPQTWTPDPRPVEEPGPAARRD
jgi:heme-degrading monooxygenase HmoA